MKIITHRIFAFIYIILLLVGSLMVIKPGASIFFLKRTLNSQAVTPDTRYAYRSGLNLSPRLFRLQDSLIYEDGQPLLLTEDSVVVNAGEGSYSITQDHEGKWYLYFSSSDNSSPVTNGRVYTLRIPTTFISRPTGFIFLIILLPGFLWFLYNSLITPEYQEILRKSLRSILDILNGFFKSIPRIMLSGSGRVRRQVKARIPDWITLFTMTILVAFFYTFMEWVFFITKPSFMSLMSFPEKVGIFLITGGFFSVACMAIIGLYILLDILAIILHFTVVTRYLIAVIPAFILSVLAFILIDNFTYTLFKFGISTSSGIWRAVYALVFVGIFAYIYLQTLRFFNLRENSMPILLFSNRWFYLAISILMISSILALTKLDFNQLTSVKTSIGSSEVNRYPNIILLGTDGLNANNMSVYGYERDTTPRISELAVTSIVAENNFPNSSNTTGSFISMLTSKLPTENRLTYSPDILMGENAYQHLPGLLKMGGYRTVEYGVPEYVDAYSLNMQYGFDEVNGITQSQTAISELLRKLGFGNLNYFLDKLSARASERIKHIFYVQDIQNPYNIVTQRVEGIGDQQKVTKLLNVIKQSPEPVFAHLHLLGTHGLKFYPHVQEFSKGEQQNQDWMVDFYDDSVLSYDSYVGQVIDSLKSNGEYDNTILIINSDHAMQWRANERIPLIIHFPDGDHASRISENTQNLDIAPTILDYLGIPVPEWMKGASLLHGNLDSHRPIISAGTYNVTMGAKRLLVLDSQQVKPPFYQFSVVNIIDCQRWYRLDLISLQWQSGDIENYKNPCDKDSMRSFDEIKQLVTQQLSLDGFDVSTLP